MSSRRHRPPPVAMVEDLDENDQVVEGSYKYARSTVDSDLSSPTRPNTGKKKNTTRRSSSPTDYNDSDAAPQQPPVRSSKSKAKEPARRPSTHRKSAVVETPRRPAARPSKTMPVHPSRGSDEASYYGVQSQTVATSRPRAQTTRPSSYYGHPPHPPLSNSAYYPQPQHGAPPQPFMPGSYPAPFVAGQAPVGHMMVPATGAGHPHVDYFNTMQDNLAARFGRQDRPQSSMGFHNGYGHEEHAHARATAQPERTVSRRVSLSRRSANDQDDRAKMPPPPRPSSARPPERVVLRPPPPRKQVGFDNGDDLSDDEDDDGTVSHSASHRTSFEYGTNAIPIRTKRLSYGNPTEYEYTESALEPSSHSRRRSSGYGFEDKFKTAAKYQQDVNGGVAAPLTAETLRAVKNSASSRSTRSSGESRDESSFKQSATTRTTRSGNSDDDITIKVPRGAIVEWGNAKISCEEGGEVAISRGGNGASQRGSDRGTVYGDDRKSRAGDRPPVRTRTSSQSGSYSRGAHPGFYAQSQYGSPPQYAPYSGLAYPEHDDYKEDRHWI